MRKQDGLAQIADLPKMSAPQLQAVHRELFGAPHPIANCQHLTRHSRNQTGLDMMPEWASSY
jgi:hypothetical protein